MAEQAPLKARALVLETLDAASYDYAITGAMLGLSGRQVYVVCRDLGITRTVTCLRRQAGLDHRGRPRKRVPTKADLRRVLELTKGSMRAAAAMFGVSPPTLKTWLEIAA
jgi:hypothetical protein